MKLIREILKLEANIEKNRLSGYDPYDIKSKSFYINAYKKKGWLRYFYYVLEFFFPILFRKINHVKPNSSFDSVLGYMIEGYIYLYLVEKNNDWKIKAEKLAKILIERSNKNYIGFSWGLPFGWQSGDNYFKPNTPNIVNTCEIASAFILLYEIEEKEEYKKVLVGIKDFIIKELKTTFEDDNKLCFSYTPNDNYRVHNANLLAAHILAKISIITKDSSLLILSNKMVNFSVDDQTEEGWLPYQYSNNNKAHISSIDLYHSGYEMRSVYSVNRHIKSKKNEIFLKKYMHFFKNYFFKNSYPITKRFKYFDIVSIHGCAEAIYCLSTIKDENNSNLKIAENIGQWTLDNMAKKDGSFIYEIRIFNFLKQKSKISYIRWGNAVMFRALTKLFYEQHLLIISKQQ